MDVAVTIVTTDMILVTEADMVQIMARHIQQEVHTVIVVALMALPLEIRLVIVVILNDFSIYTHMFFFVTFT